MSFRTNIFRGISEGMLTFVESLKDTPFEIKRVYYTYNVKKGALRGMHAHKKLKQILICVYGRIEVECSDGKERETIILDSPSKGLYLGERIWHIIKCLEDNIILLVLASDYYDEADYVRNYEEFVELVEREEKNDSTI